jgi:Na+-transporting NADH:ubiquinone oxidoreductase subunit F
LIYIASLIVFTTVILILVFILLFIEAKIVKKGDKKIVINDSEENTIIASTGTTLLNALVKNEIYLPSACGGSGSCGQCKCKVEEGGGDILPTELPHLDRSEKAGNIRLSCQLKVRSDMKIEIPPEIFSIKKYSGTVVSNRNIGAFIKELIIEVDEPVDFEAGQYMQIDVPEYKLSFTTFDIEDVFKPDWDRYNLWELTSENDEPLYRAYSMANEPAEKQRLIFTIRIATPPLDAKNAPPGIGSSYLFSLKPGDKTTLSGPFGDFRVTENGREMCFIGGGAGMAPLRSQIRDQLLRLKTDRVITYWYGARSRKEMLYDQELRDLDKQHDNFTYRVALSEPLPEDNWDDLTGFIHLAAKNNYLENHTDPSEIEFYLCGPPVMITVTLKMIDDLGVDPEMIKYDEFS